MRVFGAALVAEQQGAVANERRGVADAGPATTACKLCGAQQIPNSDAESTSLGSKEQEWIFVITSKTDETSYPTWRAYSPMSNQWQALPNMPGCEANARLLDFATAVVDGELYVLGGHYRIHAPDGNLLKVTKPTNNVRIFNPTSSKWRFGPALSTSRRSFACAADKNHIYVAGGFGTDDTPTDTAEVLDVAEGKWKSIPSLSSARTFCSGVYIRGKFLVMGGYKTGHDWGMPEIEEYMPAKSEWHCLRSLRFNEQVGPFAVLEDKYLVVATGKLQRGSFEREPVLELWKEEQEDRWRHQGGISVPHVSYSGGSYHPPVYPSGPGKDDKIPVLQDAGLVALDKKVYLFFGTACAYESWNKQDLDLVMVWDTENGDRHTAWKFVNGDGNLGGKVLGCEVLAN